MNYIKQVNYYWEQHEVFSLSGNECALYFYLLKRSNSSNWRNPIEVRNSVAIEYLNLKSFRDVQCSRDRLKQAGLIDFRTMNGSPVVVYSLFNVEAKTFAPIAKVLTKVVAKVSAEVYAGVVAEVGGTTPIVLDKQKPKQKEDSPPVSFLILEPEEIGRRLIEQEYQVKEHVMRNLQFSETQYEKLVRIFIGEKSTGENELAKNYSDVLKHFKAWVRSNADRFHKQFPSPKNQNNGTGTGANDAGHGSL